MRIRFSSNVIVLVGLILVIPLIISIGRLTGSTTRNYDSSSPTNSATSATSTRSTTPGTSQPSAEATGQYVLLAYSHDPTTAEVRISQLASVVSANWLPKVSENIRTEAQTDKRLARPVLVAYCGHSDLVSSDDVSVVVGIYISYGSTEAAAEAADASVVRKLTWQLEGGKWVVANDEPIA